MSASRIVLSNSYGTRNVGDEAILTTLVEQLGQRGFAVDILTFTPEATALRHPDAHAIRSGVFSGMWSTFAAIRRASLLVVGGGGILQDATSLGNLLLHVSRPMMAAAARTPVVISGVGIGPLKRGLSRRLTRWVCNTAVSTDVRDPHSAEVLVSIGVAKERIQQGADLAHLLPRHDSHEMGDVGRALVETLHKDRGRGRRLIGLSLRPAVGDQSRRSSMSGDDRERLKSMASTADRIIDKLDAKIAFVSMHPEQDDPIAKLVIKQMRHRDQVSLVSGKLPPATIKAAIAELDLMIGTRLHSLIFAASTGVPFIALAYDDKVAAYAGSLGLSGQVLGPARWDPDSMLDLVERSLTSSAELRKCLSTKVPELEERAAASIERICAAARPEC